MQTVCIFEDEGYARFFPLTHTRPVYDLVCGVTSLREKIESAFLGFPVMLHCRSSLKEVMGREHSDIPINTIPEADCLFINGRILADPTLKSRIPVEGEEAIYVAGETLVAARVRKEKIKDIDFDVPFSIESSLLGERIDVDVEVIRYPWDLLERNDIQIEQDVNNGLGTRSIEGVLPQRASIVGEEKVYIGKGVKIKPGVVLDTEHGPISIGHEAIVFSNAVIEGPVVIGPGTHVKAGARIAGGTTIGPVCKVGGEVERSVILGFTNKQHDGYLGHSYIGSWVNIGAGTTSSDLKNNYHSVKVYTNEGVVDTGLSFMGLIMGDHSKSGIQTMFNTGTLVGVCCNVFGADFPPKFIPSFSWGGSRGLTEYNVEKAIETARTVMARRNKELIHEEEKLLRHVFRFTADERRGICQT